MHDIQICIHSRIRVGTLAAHDTIPAIAQLAEHLTVDTCSNQMVPGSIPGGRTFLNTTQGARAATRRQRRAELKGKGRITLRLAKVGRAVAPTGLQVKVHGDTHGLNSAFPTSCPEAMQGIVQTKAGTHGAQGTQG